MSSQGETVCTAAWFLEPRGGVSHRDGRLKQFCQQERFAELPGVGQVAVKTAGDACSSNRRGLRRSNRILGLVGGRDPLSRSPRSGSPLTGLLTGITGPGSRWRGRWCPNSRPRLRWRGRLRRCDGRCRGWFGGNRRAGHHRSPLPSPEGLDASPPKFIQIRVLRSGRPRGLFLARRRRSAPQHRDHRFRHVFGGLLLTRNGGSRGRRR